MPTAGLIAGNLTLSVPTNGCLRTSLFMTDPWTGLNLDFTGYTARLEVRTDPTDPDALITVSSAAPNLNGSAITMTEATDCYGNAYTEFEIFISNADADDLPVPPDGCDPLVYDLVLTDPVGDAAPYIAGALVQPAGVTR